MNLCVIIILLWTAIAEGIFINEDKSELNLNPTQACEIKAAKPIRIQYNDYVNNNHINSKVRVNQPFGFYTARDGYIKWETLLQAIDCNHNYYHHLKCNIVALLSPIETSLELNVFKNCTWNYVINGWPNNLA